MIADKVKMILRMIKQLNSLLLVFDSLEHRTQIYKSIVKYFVNLEMELLVEKSAVDKFQNLIFVNLSSNFIQDLFEIRFGRFQYVESNSYWVNIPKDLILRLSEQNYQIIFFEMVDSILNCYPFPKDVEVLFLVDEVNEGFLLSYTFISSQEPNNFYLSIWQRYEESMQGVDCKIRFLTGHKSQLNIDIIIETNELRLCSR